MAIATIFLSALEEMEHNDGSSERPYYMPGTVLSHIRETKKGNGTYC
jgi:hypothetical protein